MYEVSVGDNRDFTLRRKPPLPRHRKDPYRESVCISAFALENAPSMGNFGIGAASNGPSEVHYSAISQNVTHLRQNLFDCK